MGEVSDQIDQSLREWVEHQPVFFVASAPLDPDGHVNVSPKGSVGGLRVLDAGTVAYLDMVGAGAETIAHLRENGRIVVMLCSFDEPPRVLRLHGRGRVVAPGEPGFDELLERGSFQGVPDPEARRSIVVVDVTRVTETPGQGVPLMSYRSERTPADRWAAQKERDAGEPLAEYQREENAESIDGLPAVDWIPPDEA